MSQYMSLPRLPTAPLPHPYLTSPFHYLTPTSPLPHLYLTPTSPPYLTPNPLSPFAFLLLHLTSPLSLCLCQARSVFPSAHTPFLWVLASPPQFGLANPPHSLHPDGQL